MKSLFTTFPILAVFFYEQGFAQEGVTKWDVAFPEPIADETRSEPPPKPEPIDFDVLSSRTMRMDVVEAPEMHGLPPITGTISVTVRLVEQPNLINPPPPLPALPPEDPVVVAKLKELAENYRSTDLVFLSATVYDKERTFLQIYPNGYIGDCVTAWSNLDFNHFSGFSTYRVKDAVDGSFYDYGLLMGIGNTSIAIAERREQLASEWAFEYKAPEIPHMPDFVDGGPAFVVVEGGKDSPAMHTLEQIHDLYRNEGARMEAAYHARELARAERKAYLLANPPKPKDLVLHYWRGQRPDNQGGAR